MKLKLKTMTFASVMINMPHALLLQSLSFILTLNIENVAKRYRLVPINMCIESYMKYNKNMHSPSPTPTQEASSPTTPFPCKS